MFKKFFIAAALLTSTPAWAQNTTCSTRPAGDNSNACASTAFVHTALITIPAAGVNGNVQFNNGGIFGADPTFNWDNIGKDLSLSSAGSSLRFPGTNGGQEIDFTRISNANRMYVSFIPTGTPSVTNALFSAGLQGGSNAYSITSFDGTTAVNLVSYLPKSIFNRAPVDGTFLNFWNGPQANRIGILTQLADRLFVGECALTDGQQPPTTSDWLETYIPGIVQNSTFCSTSSVGMNAVTTGSRTSDWVTAGGVGLAASIGMQSFGINNDTTQLSLAWAYYGEAHQFATAGPTWLMEGDTINFGTYDALSPYGGGTRSSFGIVMASGGARVGVSDTSVAFLAANNGAKWGVGFQCEAAGIRGTDGVTGSGACVQMAKGHQVAWQYSSGNIGFTLVSQVTGAATSQTLQIDDTGFNLLNNNSFNILGATNAGVFTIGSATHLQGSLKLSGVTSGTVTQTSQAAAGTPTITWGTSTGTPAVTASSPLAITAATGNITCATCATTAGASIPTIAQGDLLYGSAANTLSTLAKDTGTSRFLKNSGTSNNPAWAQPTFTDLATGTAVGFTMGGAIAMGGNNISGGGTATFTSFVGAVTGNASTATALATARAIGIGGSTGLTATGVNFDGTAAINPALTGTLIVGNGGTGAATFTSNGILYGNGASAIQVTAQGPANSVLTANAGVPAFSAAPNLNGFAIKTTGSAPQIECMASTCAFIWFATSGSTTGQRIGFGSDAVTNDLFRIYGATFGSNVLTISAATGAMTLPAMATDAAQTDATVCRVAATGLLLTGSGTLGICLGTSGAQYKTAFAPMAAGINELMKIKFSNYRYLPGHGDGGVKMQYGTTAQEVETVLPDLAGHSKTGETINYDSGALLFIGLHAIQQLKAANDNLQSRITKLEAGNVKR